jgi:hypothetical protein
MIMSIEALSAGITVKQITIRGVKEDLARALDEERRRRGTSLNKAILDLLRQGLGIGTQTYDNGLARFSGTWTRQDVTDFEKSTEMFEQTDQELWQ